MGLTANQRLAAAGLLAVTATANASNITVSTADDNQPWVYPGETYRDHKAYESWGKKGSRSVQNQTVKFCTADQEGFLVSTELVVTTPYHRGIYRKDETNMVVSYAAGEALEKTLGEFGQNHKKADIFPGDTPRTIAEGFNAVRFAQHFETALPKKFYDGPLYRPDRTAKAHDYSVKAIGIMSTMPIGPCN